MSEVSVIGGGYVGLVSAACLAEIGHHVVVIEIDPYKLALLQRGECPLYEPRLEELLKRMTLTGNLHFTNDYAAAIPDSEFAMIAVNTPSDPSGRADTSFVLDAARSVLEYAPLGLTVVLKSTVPVGTGDTVEQLARAIGRDDVEVVSNPEFLREGVAVRNFRKPDRVVVGATTLSAGRAVAELYAPLHAPIVLCSRRSSELAKYAANAFLATRISFINEIAVVCDAVDADVTEVARIMGADHRIGPAFFKAGLGWGGSCFPKDVSALAATAIDQDCRTPILHAVREVNLAQRERAIDTLRAAVAAMDNPTVGVLGLAFKPETDDVRESPALDIVTRLCLSGIRVQAHDPVAMENARKVAPEVTYCQDPYEVARGSHALLLATEWPEYVELDWSAIRLSMRGAVMLDGRNALDGRSLTDLGFTYIAFGQSASLQRDDLPVEVAYGYEYAEQAEAAS